jgi:linoleoyl-CoA desaturase
MRHIKFHHNYPNVDGWDTDIDQSALVRIAPHAPVSKFHKYQYLYLPLIYPLFLFNWLLLRDFKDFFDKNRTVQKLVDIPKIEYIKLFFFKTLFFSYTIVIPKFLLGVSWGVILLAFTIMIFTASVLALIVLLPPHANTESVFPVADEENNLPYNWFSHMLKTTNDINGTSWFTKFVMGNYNFHIVHHLFPSMHHAYYPEITERLRFLCKQNNLPYRSYNLLQALKNHYTLLKQNSVDMNIWEEDM